MLSVTVNANEIVALAKIYEVAKQYAPRAISRAVNWTGDRARTQVARAIATQASLPYGTVRDAIRTLRSSERDLEYKISAKSRALPLSEFGARQRATGVSVRVWGKRTTLPHTFIVDRLGGRVFKRVGHERLPIKQLFGPNVAQEMLRDRPPEEFKAAVQEHLPKRLEHELSRIFEPSV